MLVLTRKLDEGIIIDGNITLRILAIEDGKVKLGIDAPKEIEIHRQEIYEQIKMENMNATHVKPEAVEALKLK